MFGNDLMKGTLLKGPLTPEIHRGLPVVDFCTSALPIQLLVSFFDRTWCS